MESKAQSAPYLFLVLWKASKAVIEVDRRSIESIGFGSFSDFIILEALLHKGAQTIKELGSLAGLTSGSITTAIQRLQKKELIRREGSPHDGRSSIIYLTAAGQETIETAFESHAKHLESVFSPLNEEERETFAQLMKKVGKHAAGLK